MTWIKGLSVAAFVLTTSAVNASDGKCKILALRSGGTHGAFEVGVMSAFVDHLSKSDVHYEYLSGVSIGALNSSFFATYDYGKEKQAIEEMKKIYTEHDIRELWEFWPTRVFEPFWKKSMLNNKGMRKLIEDKLTGAKLKKKLSVEAVDAVTGQVVIFDDEVLSNDERAIQMVLSSASIPGIFPPQQIDEMWLVDGGVFQAVDLGFPIQRCREDGYKDVDIVVDMVLCFSDHVEMPEWLKEDTRWKNAYSFWNRRIDIDDYYMWYEDVTRMTRGYPDVNFRHIVAPSVKVPESGWIPIKATKEMLAVEIEIGYADGLRVINEVKQSEGGRSNQHKFLQDMLELTKVNKNDTNSKDNFL